MNCFLLGYGSFIIYLQLNNRVGMRAQGRDHASRKTEHSEGPINS